MRDLNRPMSCRGLFVAGGAAVLAPALAVCGSGDPVTSVAGQSARSWSFADDGKETVVVSDPVPRLSYAGAAPAGAVLILEGLATAIRDAAKLG